MYPFQEIEKKWQQRWAESFAFAATAASDKPKYYVLDMFPYPSGTGLHVGHLKGYVASDVVSRYKRARGYAVLHPMGWDSFGLPTERQAQKEQISPEAVTKRNIAAFRRQLDAVGLSYDWEREIMTSDPAYYRWTQWIFAKLYERGLAYTENMTVNWCPAMRTVLANEEVLDGRYIETGDPVERRTMTQWMLRITSYAERLLNDLDLLDWPESIKQMQRNWIGRSEGATIHFPLEGQHERLEVFTTRADTFFGVTYMVIAPEHPLIDILLERSDMPELRDYVMAARNRSDIARQEHAASEKTGVDTGLRVLHPVTGELLPVWTSDYVLGGYGTGAVMAVPAHDQRDFEFARTFDLPVRTVIAQDADSPPDDALTEAYSGTGYVVNSSHETLKLDGLPSKEAAKEVINWLEAHGYGAAKTQYKLRDWLFSRQRYWGEPFPILHDGEGHMALVDEEDLPVMLPDMPSDMREHAGGDRTPGAPLSQADKDWLHITREGKTWTRETNTMPQWAGSCWYYLRFADAHNNTALCSAENEQYWLPVDLYVGGAEHATLHLLYARFWHKFMYDIGVVSTPEPFTRLFTQGMIHATSFRDADGRYYTPDEVEQSDSIWHVRQTGARVEAQTEKMSKSKSNGVPPEKVIDAYGADALRLYEMFMGPVEDGGLWNAGGVRGTKRFLDKLWTLFTTKRSDTASLSGALERALHQTIRSVTQDIESLNLNTAISSFMSLLNIASKEPQLPVVFFDTIARLLQPFAPHMAEALWEGLGHSSFVFEAPWPKYDESLCVDDTIELAVQIRGKKRGIISVAPDAVQKEVVTKATSEISQLQAQRDYKKIIYVPGRIINFVY